MIRLAVLAGVLLAFSLTACSHDSPPKDDSRGFVKDWRPERVRLVCPTNDCPEGVGILVVRYDGVNSQNIMRCSATMIGPGRIMTNAHCVGEILGSEGAYFFTRVNSQTVYRRIVREVVTYYDKGRDPGRDLSIWDLEASIDQIQPRQISRHVPSDMTHLTAFVGNFVASSPADGVCWTAFELDRRDCETRPHQPLFGGGVQDQSNNLALYGCEVRHGNSGSAAFVPGDFQSVQVLINSIFVPKRPGQVSPAVATAELTEFFALGERIQCLPIDGQAEPNPICAQSGDVLTPAESAAEEDLRKKAELFNFALLDLIDRSYHPVSRSLGIVWGVRAVPALLSNVGLIPVPICLEEGPRPFQDLQGEVITTFYSHGPTGSTMELQGQLLRSLSVHIVPSPDGTSRVRLSPRDPTAAILFASEVRKSAQELLSREVVLRECTPLMLMSGQLQAVLLAVLLAPVLVPVPAADPAASRAN